ncbi:hypothetical protein EBR44_09495, partial [bacterium]|nr:hypothetical protein [bacterium]
MLREFCAAVDSRGQFCFEAIRACVSGGGSLCAREASGQAIEYARTGTVEVALTESDEARLTAIGYAVRARGVEAEWLGAAAARED